MSPAPSKYVIDANVFIEAKDVFYRFEFCQLFWDWILAGHKAGKFFSIQKVKSELIAAAPSDPARMWANAAPTSFFLADETDAQCMHIYGSVIAWSQTMAQYTEPAKNEFADYKNADAFLVAVAKRHGYGIVTLEASSPQSKRRIPLPDAATANGVTTEMIFETLSAHAHKNFTFKP